MNLSSLDAASRVGMAGPRRREPLSLEEAISRQPAGSPRAELGHFAFSVGLGVDGSYKRRSSVSCDPMSWHGEDEEIQPYRRDN